MVFKAKINQASIKKYTSVFRGNPRFSPLVTKNWVETLVIQKVQLFRISKMHVKNLRHWGARERLFRLDYIVKFCVMTLGVSITFYEGMLN